MRWIKTILVVTGGLFVLGLLLIVVVTHAFDDDDYRRLVIHGTKLLTGYTVTIDGPFAFNLSFEPAISAEAIRITSGSGQPPPPVTKIGKLHIRVALWPLVTGVLVVKKLMIEDVIMAVAINAAHASGNDRGYAWNSPPDITIPILENVRLRNIQLNVIDKAANRDVDVRLREFDIDDVGDSGPLLVAGHGSIGGKDFHIDGQLGALAAIFSGAEPYPLALNFKASGFRVSVSGTVEDFTHGEGLGLRLSGASSELSDLFKMLKIESPPLGDLKFQATVAGDTAAPRVSDLSLHLSGDNRLEIETAGNIDNAISGAGADIQFSGSCSNPETFAWLVPDLQPRLKQFQVTGALRESAGVLTIEDLSIAADAEQDMSTTAHGRMVLDGDLSAPTLKALALEIDLSAPAAPIVRHFTTARLPDMGMLSVHGRLAGPLKHLALEDFSLEIGGPDHLQMTSRGRIGRLPDRLGTGMRFAQIDLKATLRADSVQPLASGFGLDLPDLGELNVNTRIRGTSDRLELTEIDAHTRSSENLKLALSGTLPLIDGRPAAGMNLKTALSANSTGALSDVFGITMPDFGPMAASARISDRRGTYRVDELNLLIGDERTAALNVNGRIASIFESDDVFAKGIDLTADAQDLSLPQIAESLGYTLPDLGPLNGRFQVSGNSNQLAVSKAKLTTVSPRGMHIQATGGIGRIDLAGDNPLSGFDISFTGNAPQWTALPGATELDLPDLGPLKMSASLNDRSGRLDVENFEIRSGTQSQDSARLKGQFLDIGNREQMVLQAAVDAAVQPWVAKYLIPPPDAVDETLKGDIRISGTADGLRIDEIRLEMSQGRRLAMKASGRVTRLFESPEAELQLDVTASDPAAVGSMVGASLPALGPLAVTGRINGDMQKIVFTGETRFGDSTLQSTIDATVSGLRPRIDARFAANRVNLEDVGIVRPAAPVYPAVNTEGPPQAGQPLFNDRVLPLDALKAVDLNFSLDAAELVAQDITLRNLDLDIQVENGRLQAHPVKVVYADGVTEIDLIVDASTSPPVHQLKISGENVDVESLLANAHEPLFLSGDLSLILILRSTGRSCREIASNVDGEISLSIKNGEIRRIINNLSVDALNLVLNTADRRQTTRLNCLVSHVLLQEGVGNIDWFVMDTPRIKATASGSVNLATQTIEAAIIPQQKQRLFRREGSAVQISGPLRRPSISVLPVSEVARLSGTLLLPHVFLSEYALGSLWYRINRDTAISPCMQPVHYP